MDYVRIWTQIDKNDIVSHMVVVDDKFGFCTGCREIGIKIDALKKCPKCGREFKYVSSRESKGGGRGFETMVRLKNRLPDLIFVDYDDYERITGKQKAETLFKGI
jgi:protein-arginine kinase activator protein McsA